MAGRFTHLLPGPDRGRLSRLYQAVSDDDAVAAQLPFPPRRRSSENVARTRQLFPQMIFLAEYRHPGVIAVDDLPAHGATWAEWDMAFQAWRRRLAVGSWPPR